MALTSANLSNVKQVISGIGGKIVTGVIKGPTSYTAGGEPLSGVITGALGLASLDAFLLIGITDSANSLSVDAQWDTTKNCLRFFNTGQSAHAHSLVTSGGVTLAANDHLGLLTNGGTQLSQPGTGLTLAGGGASGIQNSAATLAATEVSSTTNLSTYTSVFIAIGT